MERVGAGMTDASEDIRRIEGAFDVWESRGICANILFEPRRAVIGRTYECHSGHERADIVAVYSSRGDLRGFVYALQGCMIRRETRFGGFNSGNLHKGAESRHACSNHEGIQPSPLYASSAC